MCLDLHEGAKYAVLTEAEADSQDYQRERNGKGFAILIRVEVSVQNRAHTQRIELDPSLRWHGI